MKYNKKLKVFLSHRLCDGILRVVFFRVTLKKMPSIRENMRELGFALDQVTPLLTQKASDDPTNGTAPTPLTNYLDVRQNSWQPAISNVEKISTNIYTVYVYSICLYVYYYIIISSSIFIMDAKLEPVVCKLVALHLWFSISILNVFLPDAVLWGNQHRLSSPDV